MHQDLQQIVDQTTEMLRLAEAGDWDQLSELDGSRSRNIKDFFDSNLLASESNAVAIIQDIQSTDKIILRMVLSAKDGLRLEMAQAGNNKRAMKAYLSA